MAILKKGGSNPYQGKVMTTLGYRDQRPMLCYVCGERKEGNFTVNANGQPTCPDCAGPNHAKALTGVCCEGECACGAE